MKKLLLLIFSLISLNSIAQKFREITGHPFPALINSDYASADVDNDGDLDIVSSGLNYNNSNTTETKLYINDGCGSFTLNTSNSFTGVYDGSVEFADIDGDGDPDLLVTGRTTPNVNNYVAILYENTGLFSGNFTALSLNLNDIGGPAQFADFDGVNGVDIILGNVTGNNVLKTSIFLNNGSGGFTEKTGQPFATFYSTSLDVGDIDGDGDKDLFMTNSSGAKLYVNDGSGNFSELTGSSITAVYNSTSDFFDSDNDGDLDLFVTGYQSGSGNTTNLYLNNGSGVYTNSGVVFTDASTGTGYQDASVALSDYNDDGKIDILITGETNAAPYRQISFFKNNGSNSFQLSYISQMTALQDGAIIAVDIDGDEDDDVIYSGWNNSYQSKVYRNDLNIAIDEVEACVSYTWIDGNTYYGSTTTPFYAIPGAAANGCDSLVNLHLTINYNSYQTQDVNTSCTEFTWIDGNTYTSSGTYTYTLPNSVGCDSIITLNLVVNAYGIDDQTVTCGSYTWIDGNTYLYEGDSVAAHILVGAGEGGCDSTVVLSLSFNNSGYDEFLGHGITPMNARFDYADIDNDGDQDLVVCGTNASFTRLTKLYLNDGSGSYTALNSTGLTNMFGIPVFIDADGDNDSDLLLFGNNSSTYYAHLYANNGNGTFVSAVNLSLGGNIFVNQVSVGDIDGDNDLDLVLSGTNTNSFTKWIGVLTNDGTGSFSLLAQPSMITFYERILALGDIDNDGDLDLYTAGGTSNNSFVQVFSNNGSGVFSPVSNTGLPAMNSGQAKFEDLNGDGNIDFAVTGAYYPPSGFGFGDPTFEVYLGNGNASFSKVASPGVTELKSSSFDLSDTDNDGDLDLVTSGYYQDFNFNNIYESALYSNKGDGTFKRVSGLVMEGLSAGRVAFVDVDKDADFDIINMGNDINYNPKVKVYQVETAGIGSDNQTACNSYTWIDGNTYTETTFGEYKYIVGPSSSGCDSVVFLNLTLLKNDVYDQITSCSALTWIDGNTYTESNNTATFTLTNQAGCDSVVHLLFTYDNPSVFKESASPISSLVDDENILFFDFDNDGDQDLIQTGGGSSITRLYENDGSGGFSIVSGHSIGSYSDAKVISKDLDGNSYNDLVIMGLDEFHSPKLRVYLNTSGVFSLSTQPDLPQVWQGDIEFIDIDGANGPDLVLSASAYSVDSLRLFLNNGSGIFTEDGQSPLAEIYNSSIAVGDVNGDAVDDFVIFGETGSGGSSNITSRVYVNNLGTFSELASSFPGVVNHDLILKDLDGDGDKDLMFTGNFPTTSIKYAKTFTNNGSGSFTDQANSLTPVTQGSITPFDYDADGDVDVVIFGNTDSGYISKLYENDGSASFSEKSIGLESLSKAAFAAGDIDGDGDADLLELGAFQTNPPFGGYLYYANFYLSNPNEGIDTQLSNGPFTWIDGNTYTESTNTPTYRLTNAGGCDSTVTLHLTIAAFSATSSAEIVCPGGQITLEGQNCTGTVSWSDGTTTYSQNPLTVTVSANTTYTATCSSGGSESIDVYLVPANVNNPGNTTSGLELIKAANTITSNNQILNSGTFATYEAGNHIQLNPGFKADNGTVFIAEIVGCE